MTVERIPITSEEQWLEMRKHDVTASDIAAVCGCSPYKSAMMLWLDKTDGTDAPEDNGAMRRGRWYEPAVMKAARETMGWAIVEPKVYLRDPELRIGATPDAIGFDTVGEFVVQCKTVDRRAFEKWETTSDDVKIPPLAYQLQTLTEAMLWGAPRAYLAVLVADPFNPELHTYLVPRHVEAEAKIKAAVAKFWSDIEQGIAPSVDYARDGEALKRIFKPRDVAEPPLDLSTDNMLPMILNERESLKAAIKTAEDRVKEIDAEVIHKLAGAPVATCSGYRITNSITHRKEYLVQAKSFAVLRVTKTNGEK